MQLTLSGMRGKVNTELTPEIVLRFSKSFARWIGKGSKVVLGRDTRNSSVYLSEAVSTALLSSGIHVFDAGISPTPLILHHIHNSSFDGGVIITGSHNPEDQNGIKFIDSSHTFLGTQEIEEILKFNEKTNSPALVQWNEIGTKQQIDVFSLYKKRLMFTLDSKKIKSSRLKVVIDPNAGTATGIIDVLLRKFQCKVTAINTTFIKYPYFPRKIEPVEKNLQDLSKMVKLKNADVGFAFDCDADRVTVVDQNGVINPEDTSVLLPLHSVLDHNRSQTNPKTVFVVTNIASSLAFDDITKDFDGELIRTPIGEQFLARKMSEISKTHPDSLVIGGEGSSGGFMYPWFNNARDGIFAACKICEMLSSFEGNLSELIKKIPKYFTYRENLPIGDPGKVLNDLLENLRNTTDSVSSIGNDIRICSADMKEWTLIHPSNTESVIRIIAESKKQNRSVELVKRIRNLMLQ